VSRVFETAEEFLEWLEDFELLPESNKGALSDSDNSQVGNPGIGK